MGLGSERGRRKRKVREREKWQEVGGGREVKERRKERWWKAWKGGGVERKVKWGRRRKEGEGEGEGKEIVKGGGERGGRWKGGKGEQVRLRVQCKSQRVGAKP